MPLFVGFVMQGHINRYANKALSQNAYDNFNHNGFWTVENP